MMESTREKIAVLAPIPSARVNTAVSVNPGDFSNCRNANFRSFSIPGLLSACDPPQSPVPKLSKTNGSFRDLPPAVVHRRNLMFEIEQLTG